MIRESFTLRGCIKRWN